MSNEKLPVSRGQWEYWKDQTGKVVGYVGKFPSPKIASGLAGYFHQLNITKTPYMPTMEYRDCFVLRLRFGEADILKFEAFAHSHYKFSKQTETLLAHLDPALRPAEWGTAAEKLP